MSSIFLRKKKQLLPAPDSPRLLRRWRPGSEADMIWFRCRLILALYLIYVWIYIDLYCVCIYIYTGFIWIYHIVQFTDLLTESYFSQPGATLAVSLRTTRFPDVLGHPATPSWMFRCFYQRYHPDFPIWLVVYLPLWKIWKSVGKDSPIYYGK